MFGAGRQQAINWTNFDPYVCHHVASLGHIKLKEAYIYGIQMKFQYTCVVLRYKSNSHISKGRLISLKDCFDHHSNIMDKIFCGHYISNYPNATSACTLRKCVAMGLLTRCGQVTHIYVSKLTIIGSDNGFSPGRRQAIIWSNAGILLIRTIGTNVRKF